MDIDALKAEWRRKAAARGVDVEHGATAYQVANFRAEQDKAGTRARLSALVEAHALAHPRNWRAYDGRVSRMLVSARRSRYWWAKPRLWNERDARAEHVIPRPAENTALMFLHHRALVMRCLLHARRKQPHPRPLLQRV